MHKMCEFMKRINVIAVLKLEWQHKAGHKQKKVIKQSDKVKMNE